MRIAIGLLSAWCFAVSAAEPIRGSFDAGGAKLHYQEQGKGAPVVLIHGLHASADMNWRLPGIIAELAKDYRVIAIDLPGHGKSDRPDKEEAYGVQLAEDIRLLLDHLKIDKAHIVGYSLGGMVTLKFLSVHPKRAVSGTLGGMGWMKEGSALANIWEKLPVREGLLAPKAMVTSMGKLAITEEELKRINVPVKVIVGADDPVRKLYVAPLEKFRKDWPVAVIPDAGHLTCVAKPQFREELTAWLKQNSK